MSEPVEPPHGVLTPPELAAEGLNALKEAYPSVSKKLSWHHIALLTKPYRERVKELESPWISMTKDGVQQIFPDESGWYEVMFEDRELQVLEWPMDDPYEWMLASYFRNWIAP